MKFNSVLLAFSLGTAVAYAGADSAPAHDHIARQFRGGNRGQGRGAQNKGAGQQAAAGNAAAAQQNPTSKNNTAASQGATGAANSGQIVLDPSVIQTAAMTNGLISTSANTTVPSLISNNNFIDFCVGKTITNGTQNKAGSCNPSPMGSILATDRFPAAKFQNPKNGDTIPANQDFTIMVQVNNIRLGNFVEPTTSYFLAPAQVDSTRTLIGHVHVAVQPIDSLTSTTVRDATKFAFFKGINDAGNGNGLVQVTVPGGLPAGTYTIGTMVAAANHQPPLPAVAQRGMSDDMVYITVADGVAGNAAGNAAAGQGAAGQTAASQGVQAAGQATTSQGAQAAGQAAAGNRAQAGGRGGRRGGRGRRFN